MNKTCSKCKINKSTTEFSLKRTGHNGLNSICKGCVSKEYYLNRKYYATKNKIWIENHREQYNKTRRIWRRSYYKTTESQIRKTPEYKRKRNEYRQKHSKNISYIINNRIRTKIYRTLLDKKAGRHWEDLVGYTASDLIKHLESLFKPNMTWKNYGKWHIDHIIPISSFNITSAECEDFKKCWTLENLRPLWAKINIRKGSHIDLSENHTKDHILI